MLRAFRPCRVPPRFAVRGDLNRCRRDRHTDAGGWDQHPAANDLTQETNPAQRRNQTRCASPLRLAAPQRIHLPRLRRWRTSRVTVESSPKAGGVRRALARMTEGAVPTTHLPSFPPQRFSAQTRNPGATHSTIRHALAPGSRSARLCRRAGMTLEVCAPFRPDLAQAPTRPNPRLRSRRACISRPETKGAPFGAPCGVDRSLGQTSLGLCCRSRPRRASLAMTLVAGHAADPVDLLCKFSFDNLRKVGVEPRLQHRFQEFGARHRPAVAPRRRRASFPLSSGESALVGPACDRLARASVSWVDRPPLCFLRGCGFRRRLRRRRRGFFDLHLRRLR